MSLGRCFKLMVGQEDSEEEGCCEGECGGDEVIAKMPISELQEGLVGKRGGRCRVVPRAYVLLEVVEFCSSCATLVCPFATA